jgi:electron transport complex protein RnfC
MNFLKRFKGIRTARPPEATQPVELPAPEKLYLPLRQHRGTVCEPRVEVGQEVLMGQVVGASSEFEAATVRSSVSGKVEGMVNLPDPSGTPVATIVVANDGRDAWQEEDTFPVQPDIEALSTTRPSRLLRSIREAGLVRASLQGLPLHVDLSPPMAPRSYLFMSGIPVVQQVDTLIINCLDMDPPICPNQAALTQLGPELEVGVAVLARTSGATRVVLATAAGKTPPELRQIASAREWEVASVPANHYPFAGDNLLIHSLTGREVPTPYGEPRDVGVVIEPLLTCLDVGALFTTGRPTLSRVFSVAGDVANPQTFRVRLGTPVGAVLKAAGGPNGEMGKAILGGPMVGYAHFDLNTPVTKETEGLFVQNSAHLQRYGDRACIHCGRCVAACPVNLVPAELGKLCEFKRFEEAVESNLFNCIECGVCAYVCPARRPMVHFMRHGKHEVLAARSEE